MGQIIRLKQSPVNYQQTKTEHSPIIWNTLPFFIRSSQTLKSFRWHLGTISSNLPLRQTQRLWIISIKRFWHNLNVFTYLITDTVGLPVNFEHGQGMILVKNTSMAKESATVQQEHQTLYLNINNYRPTWSRRRYWLRNTFLYQTECHYCLPYCDEVGFKESVLSVRKQYRNSSSNL